VPCVDKFLQKVSVLPPRLPLLPLFQLSRHNIDDGHAVRQSLDYPLGAARKLDMAMEGNSGFPIKRHSSRPVYHADSVPL